LAKYRELLLPFEGKSILQDIGAQGVSLAAELLYKCVCEAAEDTPLKAIELGCGCGIVSIMCSFMRPQWQISGVEIQAHLAELAQQNARRCELQIDFRQMDLRLTEGSYDLLYANPPWRKRNSGRLSANEARNHSRVELLCSMPELLSTVQRILAPKGKAILIYPQERLKDLRGLLANSLLDIIKLQIHSGNKPYFLATITHRNNV
jgi:tRNA1Val (adenine37-N6)-methyltransferase